MLPLIRLLPPLLALVLLSGSAAASLHYHTAWESGHGRHSADVHYDEESGDAWVAFGGTGVFLPSTPLPVAFDDPAPLPSALALLPPVGPLPADPPALPPVEAPGAPLPPLEPIWVPFPALPEAPAPEPAPPSAPEPPAPEDVRDTLIDVGGAAVERALGQLLGALP